DSYLKTIVGYDRANVKPLTAGRMVLTLRRLSLRPPGDKFWAGRGFPCRSTTTIHDLRRVDSDAHPDYRRHRTDRHGPRDGTRQTRARGYRAEPEPRTSPARRGSRR